MKILMAVRIEEEVKKELKKLSVDEGLTMGELIQAMILKYKEAKKNNQ